MNPDYCVPGDGLSHIHPTGYTGTKLTDWGLTGSTYTGTGSATSTDRKLLNMCLHGFLERGSTETKADLVTGVVTNIISGITVEVFDDGANDDRTLNCFAAQCHATCYTCKTGFASLAWSTGSNDLCTSCRSGWYLA